MPVELTREELFAKVWEQPMTKVAAEFGISDVGLKKICDKHRVPDLSPIIAYKDAQMRAFIPAPRRIKTLKPGL